MIFVNCRNPTVPGVNDRGVETDKFQWKRINLSKLNLLVENVVENGILKLTKWISSRKQISNLFNNFLSGPYNKLVCLERRGINFLTFTHFDCRIINPSKFSQHEPYRLFSEYPKQLEA